MSYLKSTVLEKIAQKMKTDFLCEILLFVLLLKTELNDLMNFDLNMAKTSMPHFS